MNVVLYGATGMIGSRILRELAARKHKVTAVTRHPEKVAAGANITSIAGDVFKPVDIAAKVRGADAVISAYGPGPDADDSMRLMEDSTRALLAGLKQAGVRRFLMAGGAGSLLVAPGVTLIDSGHLPAEWRDIAIAHRDALEILRQSDLEWTSLSPAGFIQPGERTGKFRLGTDSLVMDAKGESRISAEDFAVAMVDELEQSKHVRQRFTLGY